MPKEWFIVYFSVSFSYFNCNSCMTVDTSLFHVKTFHWVNQAITWYYHFFTDLCLFSYAGVSLNYLFCFQGVIDRWNFKGGSASYGNSKAHRTMGSSGMLGPCKVGWSPLDQYSFLINTAFCICIYWKYVRLTVCISLFSLHLCFSPIVVVIIYFSSLFRFLKVKKCRGEWVGSKEQ